MHLNVDLAIAQTNAMGGIDGHPLQAVFADTRADPALATRLARQLVDQSHASVLLGGVLSSECLAIQQTAVKLGVVYLTASGCPSVELTSEHCDRYTFRLMPDGPQIAGPLASYLVSTYGRRWALLYPQYAFGETQRKLFNAALMAAGAAQPLEIGIPLGEQDPAQYVNRIPMDGSVDGIINLENGADLTAVDSGLRLSGAADRLPVVFSGGKEQFGGVYPADVDGFVFASVHLSSPVESTGDDATYETAFASQVLKEPQLAEVLGGPGRAVAGGSGYQTYATVSALRQTMIASKFVDRSDTPRLIAALESFSSPRSPEFPAGAVQINKADHQGAATIHVARVAGQAEQLLQSVPPEALPPIGSCKMS
jgi:ABC-type branched-subunit amino acid transport system substrate-binding protein